MDICFYNMNHLGDVYFASMFIHLICKSNRHVNFYCYFINGHIFFKNIPNIKSICSVDELYSGQLTNGSPPELQINSQILDILINNKMQVTGDKIISFANRPVLFVNTWCRSQHLMHNDYDIYSAINVYPSLIKTINLKYNIHLDFKIINRIELLENIKYCTEDTNNTTNYIDHDFTHTIFIFNFVPRSEQFNMNRLNHVIIQLSNRNNVILSCHNNLFDNNPNIKFVDKDYNIHMTPSCKNLIDMWDIAIKCKFTILLPTGSSWCFLHKLDVLRENQLLMFSHNEYCARLNRNINILLGEKKDLLKPFTLI